MSDYHAVLIGTWTTGFIMTGPFVSYGVAHDFAVAHTGSDDVYFIFKLHDPAMFYEVSR